MSQLTNLQLSDGDGWTDIEVTFHQAVCPWNASQLGLLEISVDRHCDVLYIAEKNK